MKTAQMGTVSEGTLNPDDLIDAFASTLEDLVTRTSPKEHRDLLREWRKGVTRDEESDFIDELTNALNEYAPPYGYFGSLPGDGACFGYWIDVERAKEDALVVDGLDEVPNGYRGEVLEINDHGNATLYVAQGRHRFKQVWAIV